MPSLIGNKPNQVPSNGDLGTLAFQDASNVSVGSVTYSGNLTFTGTGNRITGDFSNATLANRVAFQTSTTNGNTAIMAIPNGTATVATLDVHNNSDPTNSSVNQVVVTSAECRYNANIRGTGTYLPMTFFTGGSERLRIDTSGNVGIGAVPSAWATITGFQVKNAGLNGFANSLYATANAYYNGSAWKYIANGFANRYQQDAGGHYFYTAASGTAGNDITFSQVLAVNKDQTVALQGTNPVSGTGITFPATQSASSDANTLDDYEEGTFTPTLSSGFSSAPTSYTSQVGTYTKIGRWVYFSLDLDPNGATANASQVEIGGLPFTSTSTAGFYGAAMMSYQTSFNTNSADSYHIGNSSTLIEVYNNAGNNRNGNDAGVNINGRIILVGMYQV